MRILVSYRGIPQSPGWATGDMVVKALRELGHEVQPYGFKYQSNEFITELPSEPEFAHAAISSIILDEWDLLLFLECNDGDPQYTELQQVHAKKTACWLFDTSYYPDHLTGLQQFFNFDYQFIANPLDLDKFPNAYYLPYACDPELHGRPLDHPKLHDFALIGSVRPDRIQLQQELEKSGIHLELIGGKFREEYIDALASSRVIINQNPTQGHGLLNMRYWEAPAAGAIVITEKRDFKVNEKALGAGFTYASVPNLVSVCKELQSDPHALDLVRKIGQQNVLGHHTYKDRCRMLLETINEDR
jgi:hypothetical protein